ncbi:T9SS type A sorting domain-containing protein [Paraflavisolibacter sp. H34]|uniref:T9SS type A sorting domain-containing protein n=1 Tax=Huijunlia imazamoxiresistens TaxID=3127457 RepID=UPI003016FC05
MKKFYLFVLIIFSNFLLARAQKATCYSYFTASGVNLVDMSTGATPVFSSPADDETSPLLSLPFNFTYAGKVYDQFSVSPNGVIGLGSLVPSLTTGSLSSFTDPVLAPYFADLKSGNGSIRYKVLTGADDQQMLVVEWNIVSYFGDAANTHALTFQAWLFEGSNRIEFVYGANNYDVNKYSGIGITAGKTDIASVNALDHSVLYNPTGGSGGAVWPGNNRAYIFDPQAGIAAGVKITANPGTTITEGTKVTFTAQTANLGATPAYLWKRNGVTEATTAAYTPDTLINNDRIECAVTSSCSAAISETAAVQMTVNPKPSLITLPLNLLRFGATATNNQVQLSWLTAEEENVDRFEVQRSTDRRDFTTISSQAARGEGAVQTDYAAVDNDPVAGTSYYRLKMVDKDNSFRYSDVRSVRIAATGILASSYPNPFGQSVQLSIRVEKAATALITVTDFLGRRVLQQQVSLTAGSNQVSLAATGWQPGVFVVQVTAGSQTALFKMVKQ